MRRITLLLSTTSERRRAGDGRPSIMLRYAKKVLVLSATLTAAMVVGLLAFSTSASADVACVTEGGACLEKTAAPDPVTVGEPLTFTIRGYCEDGCLVFSGYQGGLTDTLPAGLEFVSATATGYTDNWIPQPTCSESAGTVTCTPVAFVASNQPGQEMDVPFVATIEVIPTQCGTFTNTASLAALRLSVSETFTVVGCVPTTKAQCKNGGWRAFGYPDQGTCITAVNQNRQ